MKKKMAVGMAAAAVTGAVAYLYKRSQTKKQPSTPETSPVRQRNHDTDMVSRAKPYINPIE